MKKCILKKPLAFILAFSIMFSSGFMPKQVVQAEERTGLESRLEEMAEKKTDILSETEGVGNTNSTDLALQSTSAILVEATTGTVLYEKNPDEMLRPASVTKIMTLLLIFEEIDSGNLNLEDIVTVSEHAASMGGSQCFFEQGEQQTVQDMIKCIEVSSGNDAAVAMAEHIAGSEAAFVERMNQRAKELGMVNTNFVNACGLEAEGHLTTARDISIMSAELINNHPEIFEYSTIWMDTIIHKTARGESEFGLANTNKFLNQYTGANGLKTGFTSLAGYCMSATAERNGVQLIAVIMNAETKEIRNSEAGTLLDYGFAKCSIYTDSQVLEGLTEPAISGGVKKTVAYRDVEEYSIVLIDEDKNSVTKRFELDESLRAPIISGDTIGKVIYSIDGKIIGEVPIQADENIAEIDFLYSLRYVKSMFLIGGTN